MVGSDASGLVPQFLCQGLPRAPPAVTALPRVGKMKLVSKKMLGFFQRGKALE